MSLTANATNAVEWSGSGRIYNLQIKNCDNGIVWNSATNGLIHNVLMTNVTTAFGGSGSSVSVQHLTAKGLTSLASFSGTSSLGLTNSILISVSGLGTVTTFGGDTVAVNSGPTLTNTANVLSGTVTFGASSSGADFYLPANSALRDAGTTNIHSAAAANLRTLTTQEPVVKNSTVSTSAVWDITAPRDTDTPDLGYHYAPLDYILRGATLSTGVTVVMTNGASAGIDYSAGSWGLILGTSANFVSEGTAATPNYLTQAHAVQERSGGRPGTRACFYANGTATTASYRVRFTESSQISDDGYWIYGVANYGQLEWTHSRNYNQWTIMEMSTSSSALLGVTNTLWNRGSFYVDLRSGSANFNVRNTYFRKSFNWMFNGSGTYNVHDSVLDNLMNFTASGLTVNNGYNAYSPTNATTFSGGSNNKLVADFNWQAGPLGKFYLPSNNPLIDAGSTTAETVGLYHFTTQLSQVKETISTVDIGLHYVAGTMDESDLMARWTFDETSGTTIADASGRAHSGWLSNSTAWVSGVIGGGLQLAGTSGYGRVPNHADLTFASGDFTIAVWIKTSSAGTVLTKGGGGSPTDSEYILQASMDGSGNQGFWFRGAWYSTAATVLPANTWSHVAVVFTDADDTLHFSRNGVLIGTATASGSYASDNSKDFFLGIQGLCHCNGFPGHIDDLRLYRRALGAVEIAALAVPSTSQRYSGPVDSDGDGLADYREDRNGNGSTGSGETNFLEADSDYDGIPDGEELANGTDPLSAASTTQRMLASFRFNASNMVGDQGQLPRYTLGLAGSPGLEGGSVPITGTGGGADPQLPDGGGQRKTQSGFCIGHGEHLVQTQLGQPQRGRSGA